MPVFHPTLAILSMDVDPASGSAEIKARPKGLLAAILSLIGFGKTYTFTVDALGFNEAVAGPTSETKTYTPWSHASSSVYQTSKPVWLLAAAFPLIGAGLSLFAMPVVGGMMGGGALALAALFVIFYFISPKLTHVGIVVDSGTHEAMKVQAKTSQVEALHDLYEMIQSFMRGEGAAPAKKKAPAARRDDRDEEEPPRKPAAAAPVAGDTRLVTCPHCNTRMKVPATAVGKRISCPSCQEAFQVG